VPDVTVDLPENVYVQFEQLVDEEFLTREEAVEELLAAGIDAYNTEDTTEPVGTDLSEEFGSDIWDTAEDTDPGMTDQHDDRTF
jgi:hypothetical protein